MARWQRRAIQISILMTIGAVFFIFHGLSFELTPWNQALINSIAKHAYDSSKQEETTVLLFREKDLVDLHTYYPVPWELHAEVLSALATHAPRTVFVDFSFLDRRPGENIDALATSLCNLKQAGADVLIAAPYPTERDPGVLPELLQCATPVSPQIGYEEGVSGILAYPLQVQAGAKTAIPSAAYAAYQAYTGQPTGEAHALARGDMELIWPSGVATLNKKWMDCERPHLLESIRQVLDEGPLSLKRACPYTPTISVRDLLGSPDDPDIENALKGKTVFYGGGFNLSNDLFSSPVFENLPGVYLHAMAFDNLITLGADYKSPSRQGAGIWLDAFLLFVSCGLLVLFPRAKKNHGDTQKDQFERFKKTTIGLLAFIATFGLALAMVIYLGEIEEFLLLCAIAYVAYRVLILKDHGLLVMALVTTAMATISYFCLNLGPKSFLAFLIFAEVVRHIQHKLKELSKAHLNMLSNRKSSTRGPLYFPVWISWFALAVFSEEPHKEAR